MKVKRRRREVCRETVKKRREKTKRRKEEAPRKIRKQNEKKAQKRLKEKKNISLFSLPQPES